jgi:hypothetical protein
LNILLTYKILAGKAQERENLKELADDYNVEIGLKKVKYKYVPWIHQADLQNHFRTLECYVLGERELCKDVVCR